MATPKQRLKAAVDLAEFFKDQQPSSPAWFQVIDQCVTILLNERIAQLVKEVDSDNKANR